MPLFLLLPVFSVRDARQNDTHKTSPQTSKLVFRSQHPE